ncbi:uncharacterized protein N7458_010223 [Penicillium daleae]|uniref:Uncharacterized protein n=1 Tax=Penicillium daleae TaxID=63821 RepID=A0AAD6FZ49_9EURO|nr:uncharacterized protein N7458_010223 [Penicillium daleae]KAJ5439225.1 hypothetical protein N7458_010223 [Penicillium daleae]
MSALGNGKRETEHKGAPGRNAKLDASPVMDPIPPVFRFFAAGSDQIVRADVVRSNNGEEWQRHGWLLWLCSWMSRAHTVRTVY